MSTEDEYDRLLKQFPEKFHGVLNWKTYLDRLIKAGMRTGRTNIQIGDDIRKELRGELDDSTIRRYLPSNMKHEEKIREPGKMSGSKFALQMRANPEPNIPPAPQVIRESETVTQSFVPQTQPQPEINIDPILDCRRFGTELRMGLLNNSKVRLKINRLNEVIAISSL